MLIDEIRQQSNKIYNSVIDNRRYLHAHPELSYQEYETSAFVKARLNELRIPCETMSDTGVVATITGEQLSDRVVALRADMDALPITETNVVSYSSQNDGVMHACGHDAHTSSLIGTATILQSIRHKF
ncbi:MAG TPA: M20/M25/M40 family metallo-hydrolase, partial [Segetibacter sp.]